MRPGGMMGGRETEQVHGERANLAQVRRQLPTTHPSRSVPRHIQNPGRSASTASTRELDVQCTHLLLAGNCRKVKISFERVAYKFIVRGPQGVAPVSYPRHLSTAHLKFTLVKPLMSHSGEGTKTFLWTRTYYAQNGAFSPTQMELLDRPVEGDSE